MIKGNYATVESKGGFPFIDLWSMLYLLIVYALTLVFDQANILVYMIYLVFAIPFLHHLDKFLCICFLLSTMSYYFLGGDEGIWSIYTILALLMVLQLFMDTQMKLPIKSCLYFLWMIMAVVLSYSHSIFAYSNGMFAMIYNIAVAILIAITIKIKKDTLVSFLPKMTALQLIAYIGMLLINGHYDGYGYSVSESVNHNTFGASIAILSVIIFVKLVFFKEKSIIYKCIWVISLILSFVAGSRNALLAMVVTSVVIYLIYKYQQGKTISGGLKFLVAVCVILYLGSSILPALGVDLSRFDYVELISTGGSNRTIIWETLSPVIWQNYRWFGYGPGHFCSEQLIRSLMFLDYKHTHNTFFEAWGELGLFGLLPFALILLSAGKKSYSYIKHENHYLLIGFLFVEFLLLSSGESFFANIEIWIIFGILLGSHSILAESKTNHDLQREG